jgi:carbon monoxide dehydrogenase subunit G
VRFSGSTTFVAGRARVWSFLIDPTRLGPCAPIPITRVDDRHYRATARVGSGLFGATVQATLEIGEVRELEHARIAGRGAAAGTTVEAASSFTLRDGEMAGTTAVDWEIDLTPHGTFAGAISKLLQDRAPEAIDRALACIHEQVEG